jgi:hypothetical protein
MLIPRSFIAYCYSFQEPYEAFKIYSIACPLTLVFFKPLAKSSLVLAYSNILAHASLYSFVKAVNWSNLEGSKPYSIALSIPANISPIEKPNVSSTSILPISSMATIVSNS